MCMLNLSRRILHVHPKVYASLLSQRKKKTHLYFLWLNSVWICWYSYVLPALHTRYVFRTDPLLWGLRFMPAGAILQDSRSPAQGPGYQLKSSLASELLSVYLSHVMYISVCLILLLVLEVCGQSVYMGLTRNSVYALWLLLNIRLATCLTILFICYVY